MYLTKTEESFMSTSTHNFRLYIKTKYYLQIIQSLIHNERLRLDNSICEINSTLISQYIF